MRHEALLAAKPRTVMQVRDLARVGEAERRAAGERATAIRRGEVGHSPA
jgi:deoxyribodipyrimidine photolyase-related protein